MKRWTKILLVIIGLFVVVVVSIKLFVHANTFRPAIEKQLSAALGRNVKVGDLSLSVLRGSLVAEGLSVADDPSFSAEPFLTAKQFRIGVSLRTLIFSQELNLRSFQIEAPQITLIRAANGTWNFSSLGLLRTSGAPANASPGSSKGSAPDLSDLSVGGIAIEDGHAVIVGMAAHSQPIVCDHVNLTASNFSFRSQFPIGLDVNLPAGGTVQITGHIGPINRDDPGASPVDVQISAKHLDPLAAGLLEPSSGLSLLADADLHAISDGQTLTTGGTINMQNLKLKPGATAASKAIDLTYRSTYRPKENSGQIDEANVKIGNATMHVNGTYKANPADAEDAVVNLKLAGQSLSIDELQPLITAAAVRFPNGSVLKGGTLSMNFAVTGHAKSPVITGPVALDNVRLVGFDVGSKIHGIAALSGVKTGDTTNFQKLRLNVRVTGAGVVADNIEATIEGMGELSGSGTVSPADQLDFNLTVKNPPTKGIAAKVGVGLLSKLNGSGGNSGNGSGVPMHVGGTSEEPYITASIGGVVGKTTKSILGKKN
ncbi:MAG TPA: AsmA family protein [Candidatus Acidoferrales bacterium]|nr:AsmA family protein [Candidatus Acidoferrales bacterium]